MDTLDDAWLACLDDEIDAQPVDDAEYLWWREEDELLEMAEDYEDYLVDVEFFRWGC